METSCEEALSEGSWYNKVRQAIRLQILQSRETTSFFRDLQRDAIIEARKNVPMPCFASSAPLTKIRGLQELNRYISEPYIMNKGRMPSSSFTLSTIRHLISGERPMISGELRFDILTPVIDPEVS